MYIGNNLVWLLGDTGFFPSSKVMEGKFHFKGIRSTEKSKWDVMVLKCPIVGYLSRWERESYVSDTSRFFKDREASVGVKPHKILARRDN